jgi:hypothetical protein
MNNDIVLALEGAAGVLADLAATSVELSAAAESARASVSALDDAIAAHPEMKAEFSTASRRRLRPRARTAKAPLYQRDGQQSACP